MPVADFALRVVNVVPRRQHRASTLARHNGSASEGSPELIASLPTAMAQGYKVQHLRMLCIPQPSLPDFEKPAPIPKMGVKNAPARKPTPVGH